MNKLMLIILMCMCSPGTEAHKMGLKRVADENMFLYQTEPADLFNPFMLCRN